MLGWRIKMVEIKKETEKKKKFNPNPEKDSIKPEESGSKKWIWVVGIIVVIGLLAGAYFMF